MISLRALEPEDLELLYTIENNPEIWSLGTHEAPFSRYALRRYLEEQPSDIFSTHSLRLVITEKKKAIGLIDLYNYDAISRSAEVGIALLKEAQGKGYSSTALLLLEEHASTILNIRMLYAKIPAKRNPASISLFTKRGFKQVATLPKWHYFNGKYEDLDLLQKIF